MRLMLEGIRVAFSALWTNKLRTFLTLLGNIVGIMAVITVVSLLRGIDNYVRNDVASEGSNVVTVERISFFEAVTDYESFIHALRYNPRLTPEDVHALRETLEIPRYVSGQYSANDKVSYRRKYIDGVEIKGCDEYYPFVERLPLYAGRHVSRLEAERSAQVAVIGWKLYDSLIKPRDPLGAKIRIGTRHFEVIGVVEDLGSVLGRTRNLFCVIPAGAFTKVFGGGRSIRIKIKTDDVRQVDEAAEEAIIAMRIRHGLKPREKDDFYLTTSEQLIDLWEKISRGIMAALIALVSISLLIGGIVLMNTMLVSVTERTKEVGIRKALGARKRDIVWQFLVESTTLSLIGGMVGWSIGFAIALLIAALTPIPYSMDPLIAGSAFVLTLLIGMIFGTFPALRAAMQDPVEALRYE
jgi:putative ABC transport system permease protein